MDGGHAQGEEREGSGDDELREVELDIYRRSVARLRVEAFDTLRDQTAIASIVFGALAPFMLVSPSVFIHVASCCWMFGGFLGVMHYARRRRHGTGLMVAAAFVCIILGGVFIFVARKVGEA